MNYIESLKHRVTQLQQFLNNLKSDPGLGNPALRKELFAFAELLPPIPMILFCPACGKQHIDTEDEIPTDKTLTPEEMNKLWRNPPHKSHLCDNPKCKHVWRPADVFTVGVAEIHSKSKHDFKPPVRGQLVFP